MSLRSLTISTPFTSRVVGAVLAVLALSSVANAVTLFWDANSSLAGTGTWDINTTQNWKTTNTAGAPDAKWFPNDGTVDAAFGGAPGAFVAGQAGLGGTNGRVTLSGTANVNSLIIQPASGNYSITGGTINIANPNRSIVILTQTIGGSARAEMINSAISGGNITIVADFANTNVLSGRIDIGDNNSTANPNTFTGDLIAAGTGTGFKDSTWEQIGINNSVALPATATVRMQRDNVQLLFTAAGAAGTNPYTQTFNNNIILNDGIGLTSSGTGIASNGIGSANAGSVITLGGVISGNSDLYFRVGANGGNGIMVLGNNETYTGNTYVLTLGSASGGAIRLATNNALPATTLTFGGPTTNTANVGAFDMAGFNQKLAGINVTTTASLGGITNSGGTMSTLTIDGNVVSNFMGNIGTSTLSGTNDNIALVLAATNTGTLNLTRFTGNTYGGGTTINGGRLIAASDPFGSSTGTGAVAVNNGGTLGGNGGVGGPITVASGGHIAPSFFNLTTATTPLGITTTTGPVATLTSSGGTTFNSGSKLDIDLGAPDPTVTASVSDRLELPSAAITVPGAANSVGVNLSDATGGAAGNGTYRIMSFAAGQFTGSVSAFFTGSLPSTNSLNGSTIAYHLADDSNTIQDGTPSLATRVIAIVSGGPNALLWQGTASGNWNTSEGNFKNLGTGAAGVSFAANDNVTFDDTGSNTTIAVAAGGVQPNIVTIANNSVSYTFSGGDIKGSSLGGSSGLFLSGTGNVTIGNNYTGAGPLVSNKSGTGTTTINGAITAATGVTVNGGTLVLAGANTYTGTNTINADFTTTTNGAASKAGTLSVAADNNLGATANSIVLNGGTLATTATFTLNTNRSITTTANSGNISAAAGTTLTYGGVISGAGGITATGGGTLLLSGSSTYSGTTIVKGGLGAEASTLKIGADNALPTSSQLNINGVVSGGTGTFDLNGFNQTVAGVALTAPTGVTGNLGTITNSAGGSAKTLTVNMSNAVSAKTFAGVISGNLNFVKNGTGTQILTGANTYTGDTKDLGGTLSISSAYLADAADVYLATGSLFNLNFAATDTIRSLFIDGVGQATGTWGGTGSGAAHITPLISGTGLLNVTTATSLSGDYNNDGKVDAADYVTWRKNPGAFGGDPAGYNTWRSNFGAGGPGAGTSLGGAAVPEPTTLLIGLGMICSTLCVRRKR